MAATIACTALAQWLMNVVNNRITFQVVRDMRVRAFGQLEILPLKYNGRPTAPAMLSAALPPMWSSSAMVC